MTPASRAVWRPRLRLLAAIVAGVAFAALVLSRGHTVPQVNDHESAQTVIEAASIVAGFHRWGLLEYTHHPIGRAYLLIPLVHWESARHMLVPMAVAAVCGGLALAALLANASTLLMRGYLLALFAGLLWQPGFVAWIGNLHQHSYNMSSIVFLIFIGACARRPGIALALTGFACGWIGYDFFFLQVFTVVAVRAAFWSRRDAQPVVVRLLAAAGESAVFVSGFLVATALHYAQNVLYFSSAAMAYDDLYGSLSFRTSGLSLAERLEKVRDLTLTYGRVFLAPNGQWANRSVLLATAGAYVLAAADGLVRGRRRPDGPAAGRLLFGVVALGASLATVLSWFFVAARHAEPHLHLFPRMLLVPIIVGSCCTALLLADGVRGGGPPPARTAVFRFAVVALLIALNAWGPAVSTDTIDARFFDSAWTGATAAVRTERMAAPLLAATASASSVAPTASLDGPLAVKRDVPLVGSINIWGTDFDRNPAWRWSPSEPGPSFYEQRFAGPAAVTDIALRFWGLPKNQGAHTPAAFEIEALGADGVSRRAVARYPDAAVAPIGQGKYLCFHIRLSPPVECTGLRVIIPATVGGKAPVMTDFQAFGTPLPSP